MPLFKSLRSKSSRRSNASESSALDSNADFGPRSPSSTTYGSVKSTKNGRTNVPSGSVKSVTGAAPVSVPSPPPKYTSSSSMREELSSNGLDKGPSLMQTVSESEPKSTALDTAMPADTEAAKPRPSELFAGKGVQWDSVKLGSTPAAVPKSNTSEDLQNFLKMRRQWKPTFATDNGNSQSAFQPPDDLSKLTFSSNDSEQSKGLMSFKDLDESHQRKQKLLNSAPLGGSLFDNKAESSKTASTRASESGAAPALPSQARPAADRKASIKSVKSARRLFGGGKSSTEAASVEPMPTAGALPAGGAKTLTTDAAEAPPTEEAMADIQAVSPARAPPPVPAAAVAPAAATTEVPSGTKTSGTPLAYTTDHTVPEDADKTLTGSESGKVAFGEGAETGEATIPTDLGAPQTEQESISTQTGTAP